MLAVALYQRDETLDLLEELPCRSRVRMIRSDVCRIQSAQALDTYDVRKGVTEKHDACASTDFESVDTTRFLEHMHRALLKSDFVVHAGKLVKLCMLATPASIHHFSQN